MSSCCLRILLPAAALLAGCARSEDADMEVPRNDVDLPAPAAANVNSAIDEVASPTDELPVAEAIRKIVPTRAN